MLRYYYFQASTIFFLLVTYVRILRSGVSLTATKTDDSSGATSYSAFDGGSTQIEFIGNTIKIRREDPRRQRDQLILKSWTGALLAICSVMGALFSLVKLMPAIYGSKCHLKNSFSISKYPGASFALAESLVSVTCLALLALAALLTFALDFVPRFFLRTVPRSVSRCRRRLNARLYPESAWKPNSYEVGCNLGLEL